ncbi:uncharacterized protein [Haliotis asinina]|uniref:uncharacterized protein n=1 Tax=Haliotis asinina TaxID=109174 RepID=UPI003532334D
MEKMNQKKKAVMLMYVYWRWKHRQRKHTTWMHNILLSRRQYGEYYRLVKELELDAGRFFQYFRMSKDQFEELLALIGHNITRRACSLQRMIPAKERLAVTLRYLATGDSIRTIAFSYRLGEKTVQVIIPEVCDAIWNLGGPIYLPAPRTENDWLEVANGFKTWNFPNCLGAIDGKHILIEAPPNSGSRYFNYKGTFSIVLLALVDANYRFLVVDVGAYGRNSDGGIFAFSALGRALEGEKLNIPKDSALPGDTDHGPMPYVFVADEAFPLKRHIMRPYPGKDLPETKRIFNYRLSRARRVVENAFGILANRWRIFHRKSNMKVESVKKITLASCVLHNFVLKETTQPLPQDNQTQGSTRALVDVGGIGNHPGTDAMNIRDKYCSYFCSSSGEIPWQYTIVRRG